MTKSPHTIGADQTLEFASERMGKYKIRHLPVLKGGKLLGIISDRDVHLVEALESVDPSFLLVQDVMVTDVYAVTPDTPLENVASKMASKKYGSAVVMEKDKVVGIFTTIDALHALADQL
ncbi:MAG: CBS domain-containing protein [Deltaproteobacteria bacterium]|nr:MAG: CBS domain-containing protein [Deltaproteobacteria bacterium]